MKITLETDFLISKNIPADSFVIYSILKNGSISELENYIKTFGPFDKSIIEILIKNKMLSTNKKDITDLTVSDVSEVYKYTSEPSIWVEEFIEIFPKGVRNKAGYYIKVGKQAILKKLEKFIKTYPKLSQKEIIIEATKNYIARQAETEFQMCRMAPWFIEKDGISILAGEAQAIIDNKIKKPNTQIDLI